MFALSETSIKGLGQIRAKLVKKLGAIDAELQKRQDDEKRLEKIAQLLNDFMTMSIKITDINSIKINTFHCEIENITCCYYQDDSLPFQFSPEEMNLNQYTGKNLRALFADDKFCIKFKKNIASFGILAKFPTGCSLSVVYVLPYSGPRSGECLILEHDSIYTFQITCKTSDFLK